MSDCIFCKIANGEIPSNTVYENENFRVILDISPANLGHCLVIPKLHSENIFEMTEAMTKEAFGIAKRVADAIKSANIAQGVNILQNNGEIAGQTVHHFHIHIIPRKENDKVTIKSETVKLSNEEMTNVKELLANSIK